MKIKERSLLSSSAILLTVFIAVCYLSYYTPWLGDDTLYSFFIDESVVNFERHGVPIENLNDVALISDFSSIIKSQNNHYLLVNGRYSSHLLVQLFCGLLGQNVFSLINALFYVALLLLLLRLCNQNLKKVRVLIIAVSLIAVSFLYKFTPSVQIGYIWTFVFTLIYLNALFGGKVGLWNTPMLFLLGLYAGNSNEGLSLGLSGALLLYVAKNIKLLSVRELIVISGYCLGALAILMSPGSWARAGQIESSSLMALVLSFLRNIPAIYVLIAVVLYNTMVKRVSIRLLVERNWFYLVTMAICILFCCMARTFDNRSLSGANLMAIVVILQTLDNKDIGRLSLLAGYAFVAVFIYVEYDVVKGQRRVMQEIERQYVSSDYDGVAYVDTWPITPTVSSLLYIPHISLYGYDRSGKIFNRDLSLFELLLQKKYGLTKNIEIRPVRLKGMENKSISSGIVEFHPGVYLVIMQDEDRRRFMVERGFDLFLFSIPYDVFSPNLGTPVAEGPDWKSYIVYDDMYLVSNIHAWFE